MHTRTTIAAVAILVVAALPLGVGYVLLHGMDLNAYRPELIAFVRDRTGRDLQIEGDLGIGLRHGLLIRVNGVALANAKWGSRAQMLTAARADAHVAMLPLLWGEIRLTEIALQEVDLILESDASGTGNWQFVGPAADDRSLSSRIPSVSVASGRVTWRRVGQAGSDALVFSDVRLDAAVGGDGLRLRASALLDGDTVEINGRLPVIARREVGRPEAVDLRLSLADTHVSAQGGVQRAADGLMFDLKVDATQMDFDRVHRLSGWPLPGLPPVDLAANVSYSADGWRLQNLVLDAGRLAVTGDLRISTASGRPQLSGDLAAGEVDLAELSSLYKGAWGEGVAAGPAQSGAGPLNQFDAALGLQVGRLVARDFAFTKLQAQGRLTNGRLVIDPIKAEIAGGGRADGRIEWHGGVEQPEWHVGLRLHDVSAGLLLSAELASSIDAPVDLDLELKTLGRSVQQAVSNLAGDVRLVVGEGRARLQKIDSLAGGLTKLTGQILAEGSEDAQLNCAVADFAIAHGVAEAQVLLIDTAVSTVRGDGRVDFGAGQFDLTFTPHAKRPTLSVAVPVHVRGPLRDPQFLADSTSVVGKVVGVAGLFVFPPGAIVALGELGDSGNPCIRLMQGGTAGDAPSTVDKFRQGVGDAAKGVGNGIKGLLGP